MTLPVVTMAGRNVVDDTVEGGYGSGGVERCRRRVAGIDTMRRKSQITERQYDAAERLRLAAVTMGLRSLDYARDRVDETRGDGIVLAMTYAARDLADARTFLGVELFGLVARFAVDGCSIEELAIERYGTHRNGRPPTAGRQQLARLLLTALEALADLWWPKRPTGIHSSMEDGARPTMGGVGEGNG
ncbi:hypothetical protein [Amorphus sp. MBR-141]